MENLCDYVTSFVSDLTDCPTACVSCSVGLLFTDVTGVKNVNITDGKNYKNKT